MRIDKWLNSAGRRLGAAGIDSARLDAELILASVLNRPREWLAAHGDFALAEAVLESAEQSLTRRANREPIAYILGQKEFYGRQFIVTPDVLIPHPETEQLVEVVQTFFSKARRLLASPRRRPPGDLAPVQPFEKKFEQPAQILDVGTGSGAIAITLALELPNARVTASDISAKALGVARRNAEQLGVGKRINFVRSDLLQNICNKRDGHKQLEAGFSGPFDIIVANLPYVAPDWAVSPDTAYEPKIALFAADNGLALIKRLIRQSLDYLTPQGWLVLELDPRQLETTTRYAEKHGFGVAHQAPFILVLRRQAAAKHRK